MTTTAAHASGGTIARRKFDVDEYYRMAEAGILGPGDRVELIEGEIVEMVPIGSEHSGAVNRLTSVLGRIAGTSFTLAVQNPLRLDRKNEPIPDVSLLRPRADYYSRHHPAAADVLVLIEVCGTSLEMDRKTKLPLYAKHRVPEVWLVDVRGKKVEVYRDPSDEGFRTKVVVERSGALEPHLLPGVGMSAAALFD